MLYKHIGKQVRSFRMKSCLTQEKLAEKAGISLSFLGHIERGSRKLSVDTLVKLAQALDCSADELLGTGSLNREISASAEILLKQALELLKEHNMQK